MVDNEALMQHMADEYMNTKILRHRRIKNQEEGYIPLATQRYKKTRDES